MSRPRRAPGRRGAGLGLPVHLQQRAAHVRVAHPGRRVGVPGERRAARAAAGLVLRPVRPRRRVVGLLGLPGDDPVLDVDLPGARTGAVHPVRGADDLVVRSSGPGRRCRRPGRRSGAASAGRRSPRPCGRTGRSGPAPRRARRPTPVACSGRPGPAALHASPRRSNGCLGADAGSKVPHQTPEGPSWSVPGRRRLRGWTASE